MPREREWDAALVAIQNRPAIIAEARIALGLRCLCPTCLRLDARYPNEGYQLALFPYRRDPAPERKPQP